MPARERSSSTDHLIDTLEVTPPGFLSPISAFRVPTILHNTSKTAHLVFGLFGRHPPRSGKPVAGGLGRAEGGSVEKCEGTTRQRQEACRM